MNITFSNLQKCPGIYFLSNPKWPQEKNFASEIKILRNSACNYDIKIVSFKEEGAQKGHDLIALMHVYVRLAYFTPKSRF